MKASKKEKGKRSTKRYPNLHVSQRDVLEISQALLDAAEFSDVAHARALRERSAWPPRQYLFRSEMDNYAIHGSAHLITAYVLHQAGVSLQRPPLTPQGQPARPPKHEFTWGHLAVITAISFILGILVWHTAM